MLHVDLSSLWRPHRQYIFLMWERRLGNRKSRGYVFQSGEKVAHQAVGDEAMGLATRLRNRSRGSGMHRSLRCGCGPSSASDPKYRKGNAASRRRRRCGRTDRRPPPPWFLCRQTCRFG
jgi:hypothetical protein